MNSITQNKRYCPHQLSTRIYAVKLYRQTRDIDFVLRRYHISKASLMRWNKRYDAIKESLMDKSHRPKTPHPNAHTDEAISQTFKQYSNVCSQLEISASEESRTRKHSKFLTAEQ